MEKQLNLIALGKANYHQVLEHTLDIFKRKFHYFVDSIAGKTCREFHMYNNYLIVVLSNEVAFRVLGSLKVVPGLLLYKGDLIVSPKFHLKLVL